MSDWEKHISLLHQDVKYLIQRQEIMSKEIKELQRFSAMGAGGLKVLAAVGIVLGFVYSWVKLID